MTPAFPRLGPPERSSPASSVLCRGYDVRRRVRVPYGFVTRFPPVSLIRSRGAGTGSPGPVPLSLGTTGVSERVARRTSQVPGESVLSLCPALSPRLSRSRLTLAASVILPPRPTERRPQQSYDVEVQSHGFGTRCLRFTHRVATLRARLASGWWLAATGRESNPLDSAEGFRSLTSSLPSFPGFACR
jgi:hypothetical protein